MPLFIDSVYEYPKWSEIFKGSSILSSVQYKMTLFNNQVIYTLFVRWYASVSLNELEICCKSFYKSEN